MSRSSKSQQTPTLDAPSGPSPSEKTGSASAGPVLDAESVRWFQEKITTWHDGKYRSFPWRETRDPYKIIVAEVLLQATFSGKVAPVYEEFVRRYPSPQALASASVSDVQALIRPLGFLRRAKTLIALAEALVARLGGRVPEDERELLALPGVGPYTAGAVLCFAFDKRAGIADTNVVRVIERFFGLPSPERGYQGTPSKRQRTAALEVVPERGSRSFNLALIDFGAAVCTHTNPKCERCPLFSRCEFFAETGGWARWDYEAEPEFLSTPEDHEP